MISEIADGIVRRKRAECGQLHGECAGVLEGAARGFVLIVLQNVKEQRPCVDGRFC